MTEGRPGGAHGNLGFYSISASWTKQDRDGLTIKAIDHLHPFAFTLLYAWLFECVLAVDELGPPLLDTVLLTQSVEILIYVRPGHLDICLVITRLKRSISLTNEEMGW